MVRCCVVKFRATHKRVFANFLVLMLFELTIFYIYLSVNESVLGQKDELYTYETSNRHKLRNTTVKLTSQTQRILQKINVKGEDLPSPLNCTKQEVRLSESALPITGLASFPGAGSTWARHLIQQMTGLGTASMYCDSKLRRNGFPFECNKERQKTIVVKTHEEIHFRLFKKVVLVIRNPYDALLAYAAVTKGSHTGHPSKQVLLQASNKLFDWSLWWYVDLANGTLTRFKGSVHILQYERLKTDMVHELRKLAAFLEVNVTDHAIVCTVQNQEGNFHRKMSNAEHLDLLRTVYDQGKLLKLQEAAKKVTKIIKDKVKLDMDIGGEVEKILLQNVKNVT